MNRLTVSRRLAYVFGVLTPLAETLRRWGTWWVNPPAFLDDFLIGVFLLGGAWATRGAVFSPGPNPPSVGLGFACGMAYSSITFHWHAMRAGQVDPAPISTASVFVIKVIGGLIFVIALVLTVTHRDSQTA